MPKAKLTNVTATKLRAQDKSFSIFGKDSAGREVEVELPLSAITRIAAETRRAAMSTPRPSSIPANAPGEWGEVVPLDVRTAVVGTLQPPAGPAVAIVFDQGRDTELAFRLPPASALELGKLLQAEGEKLKDAPTPQNLKPAGPPPVAKPAPKKTKK
ncbi:hypothetical protein IZ6_30810 [Terrihabitans soli]|uniref:Uncharacterized protein n=1 Tax=Terrihabitans soli TaxID=708113 RepID=A0A6S6QRU6_9HYPH|nr:hypothetical protein [Terrihabitans soli]BCJ92346.1 hypothetical protein IZ6_30810 [Terrihabitans soli]